jgi:hypothetical protein
LNSLLTVSRTADNVIQARLGAASQPTSRFAIVPRNHTITVLMLVPNEQFTVVCKDQPPAVRMVMRSVLRDALNGEALPFDRSGLLAELKPDLLNAGVDETTVQGWFTTQKVHEFDRLISYVQQGDRKDFDDYLVKTSKEQTDKGKHTIFRDAVWLVLAEFQSRSPFQTALVNLCDPDNGKSIIACAKIPPPTPAKPPATPPKPTNTATGTTITTTITTTTNPPATAAPAAKSP